MSCVVLHQSNSCIFLHHSMSCVVLHQSNSCIFLHHSISCVVMHQSSSCIFLYQSDVFSIPYSLQKKAISFISCINRSVVFSAPINLLYIAINQLHIPAINHQWVVYSYNNQPVLHSCPSSSSIFPHQYFSLYTCASQSFIFLRQSIIYLFLLLSIIYTGCGR